MLLTKILKLKMETLLHDLVSESSCLNASCLIIERIEDKLPHDDNGQDTPLHLAGEAGYVEICQMIVDSLSIKNPLLDTNGTTLLHSLASYNPVEPYLMIMEKVDNKNPGF
jgi:ankyrin repeat protein